MRSGFALKSSGRCSRCLVDRVELVVMGGVGGFCALCIEKYVGTSPPSALALVASVKALQSPASLDACPTCGMSYGCGVCGVTPAPPGAARWTCHVERMPPSQNDFKAGGYAPPGATMADLRKILAGRATAYERLVEQWRDLLRTALMGAAVWKATGRRRVVFTRLLGSRNHFLDHFNLCGGLKPVVDAMVHLEALVDDDLKHCDPHANQRRVEPGEVPGLRIEITEL